MEKRFRLSYAFFVVAVLAFLVLGPVFGAWEWGIIVAVLGLIIGVFYYRRGK